MKVPEVVQTAIRIRVDIATEGPANHSDQESPSGPPAVGAGWSTPNQPRTSQTSPRGSANQFGPWTPSQPSIRLTAPLPWKRKRKTVETAIELVTDGK